MLEMTVCVVCLARDFWPLALYISDFMTVNHSCFAVSFAVSFISILYVLLLTFVIFLQINVNVFKGDCGINARFLCAMCATIPCLGFARLLYTVTIYNAVVIAHA